MGTKYKISKEFINLFEKFENDIKNSKKLDIKTFYGFSKYYIKNNPLSEENTTKGNPTKNLERKLKRWKDRLYNNTFQKKTYDELIKYYEALNGDYFNHQLLPDEDIEHWFD